MKKKPKIKSGRNDGTILRDPAYWRLKADILALVDLVYLGALAGAYPEESHQPTQKQAKDFKASFEKRFNKRAAYHHEQLLIELENRSPELAALLDNRALGDVRID